MTPCQANTADLLRHAALQEGANAELMLRAAKLIGLQQDWLREQSVENNALREKLEQTEAMLATSVELLAMQAKESPE